MTTRLRKLILFAAMSFAACAAGWQGARAEPACSATVYWDADFRGESWTMTENVPFVGKHWNDQISSIIVHSGTWVFYWDADYKGEQLRLGPGKYAFVGPHWNDQISSARCLEPGGVTPPGEVTPPGDYVETDHGGRYWHEHWREHMRWREHWREHARWHEHWHDHVHEHLHEHLHEREHFRPHRIAVHISHWHPGGGRHHR